MESGLVRLTDGRALGYTEFGDRSGAPLINCHGAVERRTPRGGTRCRLRSTWASWSPKAERRLLGPV